MATGTIRKPMDAVIIRNVTADAGSVASHNYARFEKVVPTVADYKAIGIIGMAGLGTSYIMTFYYNEPATKVAADLYNYSDSAKTISPIFIVLYAHV